MSLRVNTAHPQRGGCNTLSATLGVRIGENDQEQQVEPFLVLGGVRCPYSWRCERLVCARPRRNQRAPCALLWVRPAEEGLVQTQITPAQEAPRWWFSGVPSRIPATHIITPGSNSLTCQMCTNAKYHKPCLASQDMDSVMYCALCKALYCEACFGLMRVREALICASCVKYIQKKVRLPS